MFADVAMAIAAVLFAAMGLYALRSPQLVYAPFGIRADSPDGRNEARAVYGGFGVAVAAVLLVGVASAHSRANGIALAVGVALGGMAAGRIVGAVVERPTGFYPVWFYFLVELVGGALLVAAAVSH